MQRTTRPGHSLNAALYWTTASMVSEALAPERRYRTLLLAGFAAVAVWTVVTTLCVDWLAYSALPWGDHRDRWRRILEQSGLTAHLLFSSHNEHRIATSRLLFWVDHRFFDADNTFLCFSILAMQAAHAALLWRLGTRTAGVEGQGVAMAAIALTPRSRLSSSPTSPGRSSCRSYWCSSLRRRRLRRSVASRCWHDAWWLRSPGTSRPRGSDGVDSFRIRRSPTCRPISGVRKARPAALEKPSARAPPRPSRVFSACIPWCAESLDGYRSNSRRRILRPPHW